MKNMMRQIYLAILILLSLLQLRLAHAAPNDVQNFPDQVQTN